MSRFSNREKYFALVLLWVIWLLPSRAYATGIATLDLGQPTFNGSTARFQLGLTFTSGNPADTLETLDLSVHGSSSLLTAGGTDFSRFSFTLDTAAMPLWTEFDPMGGGAFPGIGLYEADLLDPSSPLSPHPAQSHHVGTLSVDLSGIPDGTPLTVTLAGAAFPFNTDAGGLIEGVPTTIADVPTGGPDPALLLFADPNGVSFEVGQDGGDEGVIPEPVTLVSCLLGLAATGLAAKRRRSRQ